MSQFMTIQYLKDHQLQQHTVYNRLMQNKNIMNRRNKSQMRIQKIILKLMEQTSMDRSSSILELIVHSQKSD